MTTKALRMLTLEIDRGVALVTLNRPESMNAMNIELRDELIETARASACRGSSAYRKPKS